jgi:putative Mn2+ efflux pump MntP
MHTMQMTKKYKTTTQRNAALTTGALLLLSLVPAVAGAVRVTELGIGAAVTPDNARFFASPIPVLAHIISSTIYAILGTFQIGGSINNRHNKHHRRIGWVLLPAGLISALSGLWMNQFYQLPPLDGALLYFMRIGFGLLMTGAIAISLVAVRWRDFEAHGAWSLRAYAIGMGAGTQVLTHLLGAPFVGSVDVFERALMMGAGWVINLAVAEWVIARRRAGRTQLASRATAHTAASLT